MTYFLKDILRQPHELENTLSNLCGTGRSALESAASALQDARHVYLTGMGSSWNAALNAEALFRIGGHPVCAVEASELSGFATLPQDAVVVAISRSGRSVEIVHLLEKARKSNATVIGITSTGTGNLAQEADIPIVVPVEPDHAISVNTYSALGLAAGALAAATLGSFSQELAAALFRAVAEAEQTFPEWQQRIAGATWLKPCAQYYFLARGSSYGSAQEARLLWEEGVKTPASAMGTGSFRHGPQEIVTNELRFCLWIDGRRMREQDFAVARDLKRMGARVMLIGQDIHEDEGELVFHLPKAPPGWQFLVDIIPAQLAAEHLAELSGVDCDTFRFCSFIVEGEYGLLRQEPAASKEVKVD